MRSNTTFRKLIIASAVALALPLSAQAVAGPHGGPGHHSHQGGHLMRGLDLTEAQRAQIREVMKTHRDANAEKRQTVREARQQLSAMALSDKYDSRMAAALAERSARAEAELAKARADVMNKTYTLLTAEQKAKLQERLAQRSERMKERMNKRS